MSELERFEVPAPAPLPAPGVAAERAMSAIAGEAAVIQAAVPVVTALIDGGMAPQNFLKGTREQNIRAGVAAAVYGAALGYGVTKSLENVFVVHGRPAIYARAAVALVIARGHEIWTEKETPTEVIVCGRRKDHDHIERAVWTIERAQQAGYTTNKKYQQEPQAMLYAKAAMQVCRRMAPDVLEGVPYSVEEMRLEQQQPQVVRATATRVARGAAGLQAAISGPTPAETVPDNTVSDDHIGGQVTVWLAAIEGATTREHLTKIADEMNESDLDDEVAREALRAALNEKWYALAPGGDNQ